MTIKNRLSCVETFFFLSFLVFLFFVSLMVCIQNHKDMIVTAGKLQRIFHIMWIVAKIWTQKSSILKSPWIVFIEENWILNMLSITIVFRPGSRSNATDEKRSLFSVFDIHLRRKNEKENSCHRCVLVHVIIIQNYWKICSFAFWLRINIEWYRLNKRRNL